MNAFACGLMALLNSAGVVPAAGSDGPNRLNGYIEGLTLDSRVVRPREMFLALRGATHDGRTYIPEAVARGASVICVDGPVTAADREQAGAAAILGIDDLGSAAGLLAAAYHDDPSSALKVLGVTGTNGKTSCTHHLAEMLGRLGEQAGLCGTLGNGFPGRLQGTGLTTADPVSLQRSLAWMRDAGAAWVAMEVSSHALDQDRVAGITFAGALFTNLSRDHLDYHGTMAAYGESKRRLFLAPGLDVAALNRDDPFGRSLIDHVPAALDVFDFSLRDRSAAVHLDAFERDSGGAFGTLVSPWGRGQFRTRLLGEFAVSNLIGSMTLLGGLGWPLADLLAVADVTPVSGRMQPFLHPGDITVVVDYAHTPDALAKALSAVRGHFSGRIICVFGCGGERDPGKRPEMGHVAETGAALVVITDDNPRSENGDTIVRDVLAGMSKDANVAVERDRRRAIELALASARSGDVILVAGKGHEDYQDGPSGRTAYSDLDTVAELTRVAPVQSDVGRARV